MYEKPGSIRLMALLIALVTAAFVGCAQPGQEAGGGGAGSAEEWAWLQQARQELQAKRRQLADLRSQLESSEDDAAAGSPAGEAGEAEGEGEGEGEGAPPVAAQVEALEKEIVERSDEFGRRLVEYINSLEIAADEPLTEQQQAAIRFKSDEDIELAEEWIEKGGDYRRAIEIYQAQLTWDPDYERLKAALAEAESMRFMNEERFSQLEKGMTRSEVRAVLGPVNQRNVREYPDRGILAWFYLKEDGSTAAVYFNKGKKDGPFRAYQFKYNATEADQGEGG